MREADSTKSIGFYDFGEFRLDVSEKVLLHDGESVYLTPKVFQTLLILVENAGRLVERDELMTEIWGDRFVEESNLTYNIKMLRKAFGDSPVNPRFIQTVPRRGYRFIAEVKKNFPVEEVKISPPADAAVKRFSPQRSLILPAAALGILLLGAIVGASWRGKIGIFARDSEAPVLKARFQAEKLTHSGAVHYAAVSPDGKTAAYVDRTGDKQGIWLRNLETSTNTSLIAPDDFHYFGINFAHSGEQIYFVRRPIADNAPSGVYRVSVAGGEPEKILDRAQGWFSLSPDDRLISYVRNAENGEESSALFVADAGDGANERRVAVRTKPYFIRDNQFAPDGESIAFAAGQSGSGGNDFRLMRVDLETGAETEISQKTFFIIQNLEWLPEAETLLITASETMSAKAGVWRVNALSGETEPLTDDANSYTKISLNRAADKIIAIESGNNYRLSFASNFASPQMLTPARAVAFAPDGKLFYSTNEGDIWSINADGSDQRQLTNHPLSDFDPYVSPDNLWVYFTSNRTGANQIWRMRAADGSEQTQITKKEGGYPCFVSPDGRWIYYESGLRQTLWRAATDGSEEIQISDRKLYAPAVSPDGNLAAYFFLDKEWKIGVMNIADGNQIKVLNYADGESPAVALEWANDNQTLYFIAKPENRNLLWRQRLDEARAQFVADLGDEQIADFALAPDGKGFAYARGAWRHDAVLISGLK